MGSKRRNASGLPKKGKGPVNVFLTPRQQSQRRLTRGRPPKFNHAKIKKEFLDRLRDGELVTDILKDLGIGNNVLHRLRARDEKFDMDYEEARIVQAGVVAARVKEIGDGRDDHSNAMRGRYLVQLTKMIKAKQITPKAAMELLAGFEKTLVARNKLQADSGRWYAAILDPKRHGTKVDMTTGGEKLPTQPVIVQFLDAEGKEVEP